jgi:hypothetical protein
MPLTVTFSWYVRAGVWVHAGIAQAFWVVSIIVRETAVPGIAGGGSSGCKPKVTFRRTLPSLSR